jgi:hypothetical protein
MTPARLRARPEAALVRDRLDGPPRRLTVTIWVHGAGHLPVGPSLLSRLPTGSTMRMTSLAVGELRLPAGVGIDLSAVHEYPYRAAEHVKRIA